MPAPYDLTPSQINDFRTDGVIVIRGMLEGSVLEDAIKDVNKIQRSRNVSQRILHKIFPAYRNLELQTYRSHKALKRVAFDSMAPTICAKLMGLDDDVNGNSNENDNEKEGPKPRSLRLLKDAVLGFSKGDKGCGWHVDDKGFWPCEDSHHDHASSSTTKRTTAHSKAKVKNRRDAGVNVWIALSTTTAKEGGGLAVSPGSHDLTGRNKLGRLVKKARISIASMGSQTTCALEMLDPESNAELERTKRVYDMQPGDAIIHDRYCFHKPDAFKEDINGSNDNDNDDNKKKAIVTKQRISLRYMPSDATFFNNGQDIDGAATQKHLQTGDPLYKAGEYFPQVWPTELENERNANAKKDEPLIGTKMLVGMMRSMVKAKMTSLKKETKKRNVLE